MNYQELDTYLHQYEESECFYKTCYEAGRSADTYQTFLANLDWEYVQKLRLILPESRPQNTTSYMDESYMDWLSEAQQKKNQNVFTSKHYRYTPEFSHKHYYFELCYLYSGSCTQTISGEEILLQSGDVLLLSPEAVHSVGIFDDTILINILIRRSTFHDTFMNVLSGENALSSFFTNVLYTTSYNNYMIFRTGNHPAVRKTISDMLIEDLESKKYSPKILDNLLMILFAILLREEEIQIELPPALQKENPYLTAILSYIQGNYRTVTLEELSSQFHFTTPYLSRLIKTHTGHTFREIIQKIRFGRAEELLKTSDLKIKDIAEAAGYESNTHFTRAFTKEYGISPSQFRETGKIK